MKIKIFFLTLLTVLPIIVSSGQKNNRKITIEGTVLDASQKPVVNALIFVDGIKLDYVTNSKGGYKIKVKRNAEKIGIFTLSDALAEEIINGRTLINITLGTVSDPQQQFSKNDAADEEEINIGYGTVKKKDLTSPVGKVGGANERYASYTSIYDMIRGEVPGVRVSGESINIQGSASFNLSTEPLFIVDGIPVSSITDIRPSMVKSIEVLKGSSASIYGSRGANGVILINMIGPND